MGFLQQFREGGRYRLGRERDFRGKKSKERERGRKSKAMSNLVEPEAGEAAWQW